MEGHVEKCVKLYVRFGAQILGSVIKSFQHPVCMIINLRLDFEIVGGLADVCFLLGVLMLCTMCDLVD